MTQNSPDNRGAARRSSLYAIVVEIGDRRIPGKVRDHSEKGCRLVLDEPLRIDDLAVTVVRGEHRMQGDIAWRNGKAVGVQFAKAPPEGMFSPAQKSLPPERHPVLGIDQTQPFRRPGLKQEALSSQEAERGRLWAHGRLDAKR